MDLVEFEPFSFPRIGFGVACIRHCCLSFSGPQRPQLTESDHAYFPLLLWWLWSLGGSTFDVVVERCRGLVLDFGLFSGLFFECVFSR